MNDLWSYLGKIGAALFIGLIAVFLIVPEKRNEIFSQLNIVQEYFKDDADNLQGSALNSLDSIIQEEKLPLPAERTLITTQKKQAYESNCSIEFSFSKPDTVKSYFTPKLKKEIEIPYNNDWGNQLFSINPFEINQYQQIEFGPLVTDSLCNWRRYFVLEINPIGQQKIEGQFCQKEVFKREQDDISIALYKVCDIDLEDESAYYKDIIQSLNIITHEKN